MKFLSLSYGGFDSCIVVFIIEVLDNAMLLKCFWSRLLASFFEVFSLYFQY